MKLIVTKDSEHQAIYLFAINTFFSFMSANLWLIFSFDFLTESFISLYILDETPR